MKETTTTTRVVGLVTGGERRRAQWRCMREPAFALTRLRDRQEARTRTRLVVVSRDPCLLFVQAQIRIVDLIVHIRLSDGAPAHLLTRAEVRVVQVVEIGRV